MIACCLLTYSVFLAWIWYRGTRGYTWRDDLDFIKQTLRRMLGYTSSQRIGDYHGVGLAEILAEEWVKENPVSAREERRK